MILVVAIVSPLSKVVELPRDLQYFFVFALALHLTRCVGILAPNIFVIPRIVPRRKAVVIARIISSVTECRVIRPAYRTPLTACIAAMGCVAAIQSPRQPEIFGPVKWRLLLARRGEIRSDLKPSGVPLQFRGMRAMNRMQLLENVAGILTLANK